MDSRTLRALLEVTPLFLFHDFQLHVMDSLKQPSPFEVKKLIDDFQLHVMDSGRNDNASRWVLRPVLSTPCNGFYLFVSPLSGLV